MSKHVVCRSRKVSEISSVVEYYQGELFGKPIFTSLPDRAKSFGSGRAAATVATALGGTAKHTTLGKIEKKAKKVEASA